MTFQEELQTLLNKYNAYIWEIKDYGQLPRPKGRRLFAPLTNSNYC